MTSYTCTFRMQHYAQARHVHNHTREAGAQGLLRGSRCEWPGPHGPPPFYGACLFRLKAKAGGSARARTAAACAPRSTGTSDISRRAREFDRELASSSLPSFLPDPEALAPGGTAGEGALFGRRFIAVLVLPAAPSCSSFIAHVHAYVCGFAMSGSLDRCDIQCITKAPGTEWDSSPSQY